MGWSGGGRFDEAIVHFQRAVEIKPDFAEAYNNLANALARSGQVDAAIVQYQKALEINPDNAGAHNNLCVGLAGAAGSTRPSPITGRHWKSKVDVMSRR